MVLPKGITFIGTDQTGVQIPTEYQQLYSNLKSTLDDFNSYLGTLNSSVNYSVTYGSELLPANSNRGEAVLGSGVMQSITLYLDRLHELGVEGVTFPVGYPLYTPSFPHYHDYVQFYKQVVQEIRKRGMTVDIESSVLFTNSAFSTLTFNYGTLPFQQFEAQRKQMISAIIQDLQPDSLNLGAEPDTQYKLTGYSEFNFPDQYAAYVQYILTGLDRGKTKIGAGIGTWGDIQFAQDLAANTNLDFIEIHVYPIISGGLQKILTVADIAHQYGKGVMLDEAWLYKVDSLQTPTIAANTEIFRKDVFSFWAPLDQEFLATLVRTAKIAKIDYISPFWTMEFFSYVDYDSATAALSYSDLVNTINTAASQNIVGDMFSSTGLFYQQLIRGQSVASSTFMTTAQNLNSSSTADNRNSSGWSLILLAGVVAIAAIATSAIIRRRTT